DDLELIGISEDTIDAYKEAITEPQTHKRKQKIRASVDFISALVMNAKCDAQEIEQAIDDLVELKPIFKNVQPNTSHLTPEERKAITYWKCGLGHNFKEIGKILKVRERQVSVLIKGGFSKLFGPSFDLEK